jgi:hypothetical protein
MKSLVRAIALAALIVAPARLVGQSDGRSVAGAAGGRFEAGAMLGAIPVSGLELGTGALIEPDGSAVGVFHAVLNASVLGQPRQLTLEGKITQGTMSGDGSASVSGTGTLDLGDGTAPVPIGYLNVAVGTNSLVLSIDSATLPVQLTNGSVTVE